MYVTTVCGLFYTAFFKALPAAFKGQKVFGNIFAAAVSVLLIICALILAYDGWKAFKKYKSAAAAAPAEAEKATA
jgi:threonine/homoserine/homoserine lactone efflux protein